MPLNHYGVLKGIPTHFRNSWTSNNHYQVRIDTGNDFFRIAVNVRSKLKPNDLFYQIIDGFQYPVLEFIKNLPTGFSPLGKKANDGSLDYIRGNLLNVQNMKVIPETQDGKNNDLNDHFDFYVQRAIKEKATIYAFGERWFPAKPNDKYFPDTPDQGIHDIHMNQGNAAPGQFAKDNGVWQDGGMMLHFPENDNWVALFLRFQSQAIHTNNITGAPLPGQPPPDPEPGPGIVSAPSIKIMAALVNPAGLEEGNEKVLIFNPTTSPVKLDGWSLVNKMQKGHPLAGTIPSGEVKTINMPKTVPLSNDGGTITLLDNVTQKIDGVSYTKVQAKKEEGAWLVF